MRIDILKKVRKDESGATAIEYGLIAALVSVISIGALNVMAESQNTMFQTVSNVLAAVDSGPGNNDAGALGGGKAAGSKGKAGKGKAGKGKAGKGKGGGKAARGKGKGGGKAAGGKGKGGGKAAGGKGKSSKGKGGGKIS